MKLKQIRVDGYKNLINCVVDLGDFNVVVGPNNSGKSNLLEALQILWPVCFGDEKIRKYIFEGRTPRFTSDTSICHLESSRNKPLSIGIVFEVMWNGDPWLADYEVVVQCGDSDKKGVGFVSEKLTAKNQKKPGPARTYISRRDRNLVVLGKEHRISRENSSLLAMKSLYPDFEGLDPELEVLVNCINRAAMTRVFAISPARLRDDIDQEKPIDDVRVSSFDLSFVLDRLKEEGKYYRLFKESLCDILELEDMVFDVQVKSVPGNGAKESGKRLRLFLLKRIGDVHSLIEEYSDGTLAVAAILEALFSTEARGPMLCLEELENCLHPAAVKRLLRFLQDHAERWPVLITTHSAYVLNGVNPEDINVAVVGEDGATHFEKVKNTKQLRDHLNKSLISFGDLLVTDFDGFRGDPK